MNEFQIAIMLRNYINSHFLGSPLRGNQTAQELCFRIEQVLNTIENTFNKNIEIPRVEVNVDFRPISRMTEGRLEWTTEGDPTVEWKLYNRQTNREIKLHEWIGFYTEAL